MAFAAFSAKRLSTVSLWYTEVLSTLGVSVATVKHAETAPTRWPVMQLQVRVGAGVGRVLWLSLQTHVVG